MATLANKSVKAGVSGVVRYCNNPDKNRPADGLYAAASYIRGGHSVERLYSRGHNGCSGNPELAIQQFRNSEALYRQKKAGAREAGLSAGKQPTVAEHFFLSFPEDENISYQTQCEIADKLCASPILKDFYAISNRHYNTDNDHSHILVSNYAKDGSRKLGMGTAKRNALRKELDRICVSYQLSIIDDPALRIGDPEREEFVRSCVGKVKVYAPADYKRLYKPSREFDRWMLEQIKAGRVAVADDVSKNRHGITQADAYRRWIAEKEDFIREQDKAAAKRSEAVLIAKEAANSKVARAYYWDKRYRSSKDGRYYAVRRYDEQGRHKPMLVLIIELMSVASYHERQYHPNPKANFGPVDQEIQRKLDMLRYQDEQDIRTPDELVQKIQTVGSDLSEARRGFSYYKNAIEKGEDLAKAIEAFEADQSADAYRIMAAHKCTTPVEIGDFKRRRQFAEKKVKDLEEQVKGLKKDYRDLKFIEAQTARMQAALEMKLSLSLDTIIEQAEDRKNEVSRKSQIFSKNL